MDSVPLAWNSSPALSWLLGREINREREREREGMGEGKRGGNR